MTKDKSDQDKLLEKLDLLFRKTTENGCTQGEVDLALGYAQKLMEKHNIEMSQIEGYADRLSADDVVDICVRDVSRSDKFEDVLACSLAKVFECDTYENLTRYPKGKTRYKRRFVGMKLDVQAVTTAFLQLLIICRAMARANLGPGNTLKHRQYCRGFAFGVWETACAIEQERNALRAKDVDCTALVVAKNTLINQYMDGMDDLESTTHSTPRTVEFEKGFADGEKYELNHVQADKVEACD